MKILKDPQKILNYYFLMVQASFCAEKYSITLEFLAKTFNLISNEIFDIYSDEFDINYYNLKLIQAKAFYFTGETKKAIELCDEYLQTLLSIKKSQSGTTDNSLKNTIDESIAEALAFKALSELNQNDLNFKNTVKYIAQEHSNTFNASLLNTIFDVYKNMSIKSFGLLEKLVLEEKGNLLEKNVSVLFYLFACIQMGHFGKALKLAFKYKKKRVYSKQLNLYFDLIIATHFINIGLYQQAKNQIEEIIDKAKDNQFKFVLYTSWLLLARAQNGLNNPNRAYEILNQSNIVMEEQQNVPKIFSIIFKRELAKTLTSMGLISETKTPLEIALHQSIASEYIFFKIDTALSLISLINNELHSQEDPIHRNKLEIELENLNALTHDAIESINNPIIKESFIKEFQSKTN